jgi:hypothetical protein
MRRSTRRRRPSYASPVEIHLAKRVSLKRDPLFSERQLQELLVGNITILGLGELDVVRQEKIQPNAGRLDLLLADPESDTRYVVELQLGPTDPSHIIRTIEYWDLERRRYPQYEHVAVIVAEDITTRFLNVISLFNGFIPLIAIQLECYEVNGARTLVATRILDATTLATDGEDPPESIVDWTYWERKASAPVLGLVRDLFEMLHKHDPIAQLQLRKRHFGLARHGSTNNYVVFIPLKGAVKVRFRVARDEQVDERLRAAGADFEYRPTRGMYVVRIEPAEADTMSPIVDELFRRAVEELAERV